MERILVNVRHEAKTIALDASPQNTSWTSALDNTPVTLTSTVSLTPYAYWILKK